jgi:hypothetical protein
MSYLQQGSSRLKLNLQGRYEVSGCRISCRAILLAYLILLYVIATPASAGALEQRSPTLTVSILEISPSSGGPGTVVEVRGGEIYARVNLYLGVIKGGPTALLGTAEGQGPVGSFVTRVTIPAVWPSGQPIAERDLYISADTGSGWGASKEFTFTPGSLPVAGTKQAQDWLGLALLAVSFIAAGAWAVGRSRTAHESSRVR